jgi:hypothetical protein
VSPRYRWIKLYTIAYLISISVVIGVFIVMDHYDPADRQPINWLGSIFLFFALYVICFVLVGISFAPRQYAVQLELEEFQRQQQTRASQTDGSHDYPGVTVIPDYSPPTDGPGEYRIQGVNRSTREDVAINIPADSAANARIKAELNDILVTEVTKVS